MSSQIFVWKQRVFHCLMVLQIKWVCIKNFKLCKHFTLLQSRIKYYSKCHSLCLDVTFVYFMQTGQKARQWELVNQPRKSSIVFFRFMCFILFLTKSCINGYSLIERAFKWLKTCVCIPFNTITDTFNLNWGKWITLELNCFASGKSQALRIK